MKRWAPGPPRGGHHRGGEQPLAVALAVFLWIAAPLLSVHAQPLTWEQWVPLVGAVDVGGPRGDGTLVAMAAGRLFLVAPDGAGVPFATGVDGYSGSADA